MDITTPLRLGTQLSEKIAILNVSNPDRVKILFKPTYFAAEEFTIFVLAHLFSEKNVLVHNL
jgi:hypothetical protein